jgi:hypothetical protein
VVQTTPQVGRRPVDQGHMVLVISLVVVCWIVLPLPFAVAVGRAFHAGHRGPVPPPREPAAPDTVLGDLAA